jgi:hypothetical protein
MSKDQALAVADTILRTFGRAVVDPASQMMPARKKRRYAKRDVGWNSSTALSAPRVGRRFRADDPRNSAGDAPARPACKLRTRR